MLFFILFFFLTAVSLFSQEVDELRAQRERLLEEISNTSQLIESKRNTRENTFQQLNLISREVSIREQLLADLEIEIVEIDRELENNQRQINQLEQQIEVLKQEYSLLLQDTYRRRNSLDELVFFMSAQGFSEAYQRYRLLKEYSRYRQQQGRSLQESQARLQALIEDINLQRQQKEENLKNIEQEFQALNQSRIQKRSLINELQQEESWLRDELRKKEKQAQQLENRILEYIRTARTGVVGADFEDYHGKLIWPVKKGIVINEFGEHAHPVLNNVTIKNNGIDIRSLIDDQVISVHNGEVSRIVSIPGYNTAVIVRHGKYLTVYANLRTVSVTQGQTVYAGDNLGNLYTDSDNEEAVLHFEIWHDNNKLDPVNWLLP